MQVHELVHHLPCLTPALLGFYRFDLLHAYEQHMCSSILHRDSVSAQTVSTPITGVTAQAIAQHITELNLSRPGYDLQEGHQRE